MGLGRVCPVASAPVRGGTGRVGPIGVHPVPSPSPAMASRSAARILPLALALAVVAEVSWARRPSGALWPGQGCAALGRCCLGRDPTCVAHGPPRCFCDQACGAVRDCCPDYARVCPGAPPGQEEQGGGAAGGGALGTRGSGVWGRGG